MTSKFGDWSMRMSALVCRDLRVSGAGGHQRQHKVPAVLGHCWNNKRAVASRGRASSTYRATLRYLKTQKQQTGNYRLAAILSQHAALSR